MDEFDVVAGKKRPMVSVCVQTYRHASFIEQCLNSILSQKTNFPFEIILGEDESDDGTREICERFAAQYSDKIRLFLRSRKDVIKIGGKESGRFNFKENLKASDGKYVALCEGDDYWTDDLKLQKQVDFLESHPDYSVCFHRVQILKGEDLLDDYITRVPSATTTLTDIAKGNYIHTPTCMFRNTLKFPDWFDEILAGDFALHILNAQKGKLYCIDEVMAVYRVHSGGIWSTRSDEDRQLMWISVLNSLCNHLDGEVLEVLSEQRLDWAIELYKKGFKSETSSLLQEEAIRILDRYEKTKNERAKLIADPAYLEKNVSGTFLLKALFKKIF